MPIYEGTSQIQSLMAMKDTLGGIIKDPQGFITEGSDTVARHVLTLPLNRRVARLQSLSLATQQHLITRMAAAEFSSLRGKPMSAWPRRFLKNWDPKRDFSFAMLHAERLTQILVDEAVCELLLDQSNAYPERRPLLEKYLERAELRCKHLHDVITSTGDRLLDILNKPHQDTAQANAEACLRQGTPIAFWQCSTVIHEQHYRLQFRAD